jgi:hypothetical protein
MRLISFVTTGELCLLPPPPPADEQDEPFAVSNPNGMGGMGAHDGGGDAPLATENSRVGVDALADSIRRWLQVRV